LKIKAKSYQYTN